MLNERSFRTPDFGLLTPVRGWEYHKFVRGQVNSEPQTIGFRAAQKSKFLSFIHKANGRLLREAGKADAARLEAFLLRHGPKIPRTTPRYAIERFPQAKRRRLLEATKG